jgi:16S rRNA (uracil1498-N3)-methyltransferase
MSRLPRIWHPGVPGPGARVELDAGEAHHAFRVLRLRAGDPLEVFDGRGRGWDAQVIRSERGGVSVRIGERRIDPVDSALVVRLVQARVRPERLEWALQKGTEIGLSSFLVVPSGRSEGPAPSPARRERWGRVVLEACKQSGRRRLPELLEAAALPSVPASVLALVLHGAPGSPPLGEYLAGPVPAEVWLAVGPEGGYGEEELEAFESAGWRRASLGPRVLRTETAGPVAGALVLHAWGDLGRSRSALPDH